MGLNDSVNQVTARKPGLPESCLLLWSLPLPCAKPTPQQCGLCHLSCPPPNPHQVCSTPQALGYFCPVSRSSLGEMRSFRLPQLVSLFLLGHQQIDKTHAAHKFSCQYTNCLPLSKGFGECLAGFSVTPVGRHNPSCPFIRVWARWRRAKFTEAAVHLPGARVA